jgi:hypothetical protein
VISLVNIFWSSCLIAVILALAPHNAVAKEYLYISSYHKGYYYSDIHQDDRDIIYQSFPDTFTLVYRYRTQLLTLPKPTTSGDGDDDHPHGYIPAPLQVPVDALPDGRLQLSQGSSPW